LLATVTTAVSQQSQPGSAAGPTPDATSTCAHSFTTGSGHTYLQTCITTNGNVVEFQSPAGYEHIRNGLFAEGYSICDSTAYNDWADYGDSGNWQAPILLSSSATSVKLARTTQDGNWTVTQTFTQAAATVSLKITMAVKNNSSTIRPVHIVRYVDTDAYNTTTNDFATTSESVFGWVEGKGGLLLQNSGATHPYAALIQNSSFPPDPCNPGFSGVAGPITFVDGSMLLYHDSAALFPKTSLTISMTYKRM
jgi:hypothetical protein